MDGWGLRAEVPTAAGPCPANAPAIFTLRRKPGTVRPRTPTTEQLLKRAEDLIDQDQEYREDFNAGRISSGTSPFRVSLFIAHLGDAISRTNQLRFWKKRTAKTTTIASTAISTQFVSVTPRPPTSISLMTKEYAFLP